MAGINLKRFCGGADGPVYLREPFTVGDFTYAANGHIFVRVPARGNIPEPAPSMMFNSYAAVADRIDAWLAGAPNFLFRGKMLPPMPKRASQKPWTESFEIRGRPFAGQYVRMISRLPGATIIGDMPDDRSGRGKKSRALLFAFDGDGFGGLMPLSWSLSNHHDTGI